jgi:hypothetical protein
LLALRSDPAPIQFISQQISDAPFRVLASFLPVYDYLFENYNIANPVQRLHACPAIGMPRHCCYAVRAAAIPRRNIGSLNLNKCCT